ncbi:MAG: hypothetical protein GY795_03470 [Desulfobacterales bacterium]|nr:hypothetical protein [Desulfobacterales bacterium]
MGINQKGNLILKSVPNRGILRDTVRCLTAGVAENTPEEEIISKIEPPIKNSEGQEQTKHPGNNQNEFIRDTEHPALNMHIKSLHIETGAMHLFNAW